MINLCYYSYLVQLNLYGILLLVLPAENSLSQSIEPVSEEKVGTLLSLIPQVELSALDPSSFATPIFYCFGAIASPISSSFLPLLERLLALLAVDCFTSFACARIHRPSLYFAAGAAPLHLVSTRIINGGN